MKREGEGGWCLGSMNRVHCGKGLTCTGWEASREYTILWEVKGGIFTDSASVLAALKLPIGKRYHIFVTHSTSDQQWAEDVVAPLCGKWKVKACYQCMPDPSCYDDRGIKECMKQSCVILIGLSQNYLHSSR